MLFLAAVLFTVTQDFRMHVVSSCSGRVCRENVLKGMSSLTLTPTMVMLCNRPSLDALLIAIVSQPMDILK